MPNNETEKIKSAPKPAFRLTAHKLRGYGLVILAVVLLVFLASAFFGHPTKSLKIGDAKYSLRVARTEAEHRRGLGGTQPLTAEQGMVFIYKEPRELCFWMKDMSYAIDIIWLDADKKVTAIEKNVDPATYPKTFCHDGSYVIELRSGEAVRHNLEQGQTLSF
ncbi:MAG: DUF192 domain-containing protein [Candidatus Saccharimonadales bacterium]